MYDAELKRMQELVRTRRYVMTLHAEDEMDADGLSIFDVESVILTGKISERQRDRQPDEWKYLVNGQALDGAAVIVVTKFGPTDKLVLITVFRE
jgi:hypothetical protein